MKAFRMLLYLTKRFPLYVICHFTDAVLAALPNFVGNVLLLKYLMRALLDKEPVSGMLAILAAVALFLIAADIYRAWFDNQYRPRAEERIRRAFYIDIRNAAAKCELSAYDDPAFYDDMTYIDRNILRDSLALLSHVSDMAAGLIDILLIINLFYETGLEMLILSGSAVMLTMAFDVPMVRLRNRRRYAVSGMERKRGYFRDCFLTRENVLERRMTKVDSLLCARYDESVGQQIACERRFGGKLLALNTLRDLLPTNLLMRFVLIACLLYRGMKARSLAGSDFIAAYNGVNVVMSEIMRIVKLWGEMAASLYTVGKYERFLASVPKEEGSGSERQEGYGRHDGQKWHDGQKQHDGQEGHDRDMGEAGEDGREAHSIEFRHVSFAYPGTGRRVLKDISFRIRSGEKVAIVGRNGSGKTTLIHLLMGLYYPTEGEILVDGKALRREDYPQYRRSFTAFFQGMKPLEATVAENVALDVDSNPAKVRRALEKADCGHLFPEPERQMIGIRFDSAGRILSGGEAQKLMLAHCYYSGRQTLVMDEPSSALDPIAEREFNRRISELSDDKTVIFVTHRLSTVHMAQRIYVVDRGRLAGQGSHERLLKENGLYRELWNAQAMPGESAADRQNLQQCSG